MKRETIAANQMLSLPRESPAYYYWLGVSQGRKESPMFRDDIVLKLEQERIRREQEDEHYLRLSRALETNQPKRDEESEWDR